jgi:hypothetical protein
MSDAKKPQLYEESLRHVSNEGVAGNIAEMSGLWDLIVDLSNKAGKPGESPLLKRVRPVKFAMQMVIGTLIVAFVVFYIAYLIFNSLVHIRLPELNFLAVVGEMLALSAAIDLGYMLFTPGIDEAVEPIIVGMAATILILVSRVKEMVSGAKEFSKVPSVDLVWPVLCVVMLAGTMALLFFIKARFFNNDQINHNHQGGTTLQTTTPAPSTPLS